MQPEGHLDLEMTIGDVNLHISQETQSPYSVSREMSMIKVQFHILRSQCPRCCILPRVLRRGLKWPSDSESAIAYPLMLRNRVCSPCIICRDRQSAQDALGVKEHGVYSHEPTWGRW